MPLDALLSWVLYFALPLGKDLEVEFWDIMPRELQ